MEEDVFDENASEMSLIEKDWIKLNNTRAKDGFIAGSTAGQESTLQNGFNSGFKQGFVSSFLLSEIKGVLNALMSYRASYEGHPITDDVVLDAQRLLDDISQLEADCVAEDFLSMKIRSGSFNNVESEHMRSAVVDLESLSMDTDERSCNPHSCSCSTSSESLDVTKCCSSENSCSQPPINEPMLISSGDNFSSNAKHDHAEEIDNSSIRLQDARKLLLSCPEVQDIVRRCKHVLKRLRWTDDMIDNLL